MMITRESLMTLEAYAKARPGMRAEVMAQKKLRRVFLGDNLMLIFENELLIRYQVQEMLRVEKIFEEDGIAHELASYVPLTPDGTNFKATMQIEYADEAERRRMLGMLKGIEDRVWIQVAGCAKVFAIADEDLVRENEEKTSAVHFLRFELDTEMVAKLKSGAALGVGVDHAEYTATISALPADVLASLVTDLR
ncbi:MAG: DUF3501 family protein [Rhodocyclaceae bacterium]|nr:DUF3501 family protein [Rhodocyclaceae bacterium]